MTMKSTFWCFLAYIPTVLCFSSSKAFFTQVISDVDDTLKVRPPPDDHHSHFLFSLTRHRQSSGGVNVAGVALGGIDVQYERGDFYPGVAEFMLQVSLSSSTVPPKVAILTARAEEFKAALELKESSKLGKLFKQTGEAAGFPGWTFGTVLYGSVVEWIDQKNKGFRKFSNFEKLAQQDPTGRIMEYVYVGDTGELDQEAGETMLREYPEIVKAVFLHVVSGERGKLAIPPPKLINGRPMVFFRTYVGAAVEAVHLGFMSLEGLERVIEASQLALAGVPTDSDKWDDVNDDIERANVLLANV